MLPMVILNFPLLTGCDTTQRPDQQTFSGSRAAIACFRSRPTDNCTGSAAPSVLFYQCPRGTVAQITTGYLFHSVDHPFAPVTPHTIIFFFIHLSAAHPPSLVVIMVFGRGHVQRKSAHFIVSSSIPV